MDQDNGRALSGDGRVQAVGQWWLSAARGAATGSRRDPSRRIQQRTLVISEDLVERPFHGIAVTQAHPHAQATSLSFHRLVFHVERRALTVPVPEHLQSVGDDLPAGEEERQVTASQAADGQVKQTRAFRGRADDTAIGIGIDPRLSPSAPRHIAGFDSGFM